MYELIYTTKFKKDLKRVARRNLKDLELSKEVIITLHHQGREGISLFMKPHQLKGNYQKYWECHIKPDLLIIWFQVEDPKTIKLIRIGTHADLFK